MRSWAPELVIAAVGVLLGAVGARRMGPVPEGSVPEASSAEVPDLAPTGRCPQGAAPGEAHAAEDELLEHQEELEELKDLEAEAHRIGAVPFPWPDDPPPHMRPEAVAASLEEVREAKPERFEGWEVQVDCSEYPCLVIYNGDASLGDRAPAPGFEKGYGNFSLFNPERQQEIYYPLPQGGHLPEEVERRLEVRRVELLNLETP